MLAVEELGLVYDRLSLREPSGAAISVGSGLAPPSSAGIG